MATVGLHCCVGAVGAPCYGGWVSHCSSFSCWGAQAQELWHTGLLVPQPVGSSRTRDQTRVSWISKGILYHWATRETQKFIILMKSNLLNFFGSLYFFLYFLNFFCIFLN